MPPRLGIVGAGRVGSTLARLLHERGYTIAAVHSRTVEHAQALAARVEAAVAADAGEAIGRADLTLLTVPDDCIENLADAVREDDLSGRGVAHTSGAHDAGVLAALAAKGALTGGLHPAYPFADVERAMVGLPGATFAVEAVDEPLRRWLCDIVAALDGAVMIVPAAYKAVYHSALVFASNYVVTLYGAAQRMLLGLGAGQGAVDGALNALLAETAANLRTQGIPAALTGPLARGDLDTIAAHVNALAAFDEELAAAYRQLARLSYPMLAERGVATEAVERLLREGEQDAINAS